VTSVAKEPTAFSNEADVGREGADFFSNEADFDSRGTDVFSAQGDLDRDGASLTWLQRIEIIASVRLATG
jgi:hypothetical protein